MQVHMLSSMSLNLVPLGGSLDPVHKDSSSSHQEIQEHLEGRGRGGEGRGGEGGGLSGERQRKRERQRSRDVIITYRSVHIIAKKISPSSAILTTK